MTISDERSETDSDQLPATDEVRGTSEGSTLLFSVVVPSRNRPDQLAACLGALAALDCDPGKFEVIVVDDGSVPPLDTENVRVPESLQLRIIRQDNAGPATARNTGAAAAHGRYLAFIDDDCLPTPSWLSEFETRLGDGEELIGGLILNDLPGNIYSSASQLLIDYLYGYFKGSDNLFFCSNNMCVPAKAFETVGGFDRGFPLPAGEDRDFCRRWVEESRPMQFAREAVVLHAHDLTLGRFWRQHFRYGRGAFHFHSRRASRSGDRLKVEPVRFYLALLMYPYKSLSWARATLVSSLLVLSQAANAAGFFREVARHRNRIFATATARGRTTSL